MSFSSSYASLFKNGILKKDFTPDFTSMSFKEGKNLEKDFQNCPDCFNE
jgi:hypothetical protein